MVYLNNLYWLLFLIALILPGVQKSYAAPEKEASLNTVSGLPSDHVYFIMQDHNGYLWLSTDKGVIKYDGYHLKTFNLSSGLYNDDIWALFEDNRSRIWLSNISDEVGYIYKDRYSKPFAVHNPLIIKPTNIRNYRGCVIFGNSYADKQLFIEYNDTLYSYPVLPSSNLNQLYIRDSGGVLLRKKENIYTLEPGLTGFRQRLLCRTDGRFYKADTSLAHMNRSYLFEKYLINCWFDSSAIYTTDLTNGHTLMLPVIKDKDEHVYNLYHAGRSMYFVTNKKVYQYDALMHQVHTYLFSDALSRQTVSYVFENSFWGTCTATVMNGMYRDNHHNKFEKIDSVDLKNYQFVGQSVRGGCWWNKDLHAIATIGRKEISYKTYPFVNDIKKVIRYDSSHSLVLAGNDIYWLDRQGKMSSYFSTGRPAHSYQLDGPAASLQPFVYHKSGPLKDGFFYGDALYGIAHMMGFCRFKWSADSMLDIGQFKNNYMSKGFTFDSLQKTFWTYSERQIRLYFLRADGYIEQSPLFRSYGLKKISQIIIDNHSGNVFIKDQTRLFIYNTRKNLLREALIHYPLAGMFISLQNDRLIVAGKPGIFISKIEGPAALFEPFACYNYKYSNYHSVTGLQTDDSALLLNTDKGLYKVNITDSSRSACTQPNRIACKLLINYKDSLINIHQQDTIRMDQENRQLLLELINPDGTGKLSYQYRLGGLQSSWNALNGNELFLQHLLPGRYYALSLIASDEIWTGDRNDIIIYLVPYWWQTPAGKKTLWTTGILFLLVSCFLLVILTRRIVSKKHLQKNRKLELELKSIYAQINPHFIFNTLNTGLYYIRKQKTREALDHFIAFSKLLRAYIKSVRNKLITLDEEVENLGNYISLQQARFEHKFDYLLVVDDTLDHRLKLPAFLLQPLVENAINHGLMHKEGKGTLRVEFKEGVTRSELICRITDNGIGRTAVRQYQRDNDTSASSYGTQLTNELIHIFNSYRQIQLDLVYIDHVLPETGTTVVITIKYYQ